MLDQFQPAAQVLRLAHLYTLRPEQREAGTSSGNFRVYMPSEDQILKSGIKEHDEHVKHIPATAHPSFHACPGFSLRFLLCVRKLNMHIVCRHVSADRAERRGSNCADMKWRFLHLQVRRDGGLFQLYRLTPLPRQGNLPTAPACAGWMGPCEAGRGGWGSPSRSKSMR